MIQFILTATWLQVPPSRGVTVGISQSRIGELRTSHIANIVAVFSLRRGISQKVYAVSYLYLLVGLEVSLSQWGGPSVCRHIRKCAI